MRRAAKRDTTEALICARLALEGCEVLKLSAPGHPDLLVAYRGRLTLLECKSPGGKLTPAQKVLFADLKEVGVDVHVVTTPDEAWGAIR